jgi:antiviral defense system Shedu protein SduA
MPESPPRDSKPEPAHGPTLAQFTIQPGQPIRWSQPPSAQAPPGSLFAQLGETLKAYRNAAKRLLETKYPELRELVPPYLQGCCSSVAVVCDDAVIIRWDDDPEPKVRIVTTTTATPLETRIETWAPRLSERHVWCPPNAPNFELPADSPRLQFFKVGPQGQKELVIDAAFGIVVNWDESLYARAAEEAGRPLPLVGILPDFEILIEMDIVEAAAVPTLGSGQRALVRQRFRLPVGWSAFEIYPRVAPDAWKPEAAAGWAEIDLLAIAARHSLRESEFHALDSRAAARREYWRLLDEFGGLLNGNEAPLQAFLQAHPALLSPTHLKVWPKVQLGHRNTDFILQEATGDYVLVELEAPTRHLFRKDGQQHEELTHAVNQVTDWIRYLEDNLSTVQRELGLEGISTNPRSLIVIGRSAGLSDADRRKLTTVQNMVPKLQILTYDDVLAAGEATIANLFGPRLIMGAGAEIYYIWTKDHTETPTAGG